jgi:hypothetical protein
LPITTNGSLSCAVTANTYDTTYDGDLTVKNTGSAAIANPSITFNVPSAATMHPSGCSVAVPAGFTVTSRAQPSGKSTAITMAYSGSLAANSTMTLHYTTDQASEAVATHVMVNGVLCSPSQ